MFAITRCTSLSSFAVHFKDPELSRLTSCIPLHYLGARADSSTERYSRAFEKFRLWAAGHKEINALPSFSAIEAAYYGIRWAHNLCGFDNTCLSILVKGVLESSKRSLSVILAISEKSACVNANLSDLGPAAICVTAYAGFSL